MTPLFLCGENSYLVYGFLPLFTYHGPVQGAAPCAIMSTEEPTATPGNTLLTARNCRNL